MKVKENNFWRNYHNNKYRLYIPSGEYDIQYRGKGVFVLSDEKHVYIVEAKDLKDEDSLSLYEEAAEKMGEALAAISELAAVSFHNTTLGIAADAIGHNYNLPENRYKSIIGKARE